MPDRIEPTEELLNNLWREQAEWTQKSLEQDLAQGYSDDGHDYTTAALELCNLFYVFRLDTMLKDLDVLLNTPKPDMDDDSHYEYWETFERNHGYPALSTYASDGICPAIYELDCPALPKEASC